MLVFSKRKELTKLYEKWIKENDLKDCTNNFISFLCFNDLLNPEKALSFIAKNGGVE